MKKTILNLGQALNKAEQKQINGGKQLCKPHVPFGQIRKCIYFGLQCAEIECRLLY